MLDVSLDVVLERAEQIRKAVREMYVVYRGQSLGAVTLSMGVAVFPDHSTSGEVLLRIADKALYAAKAAGRDRVLVGLTEG
jgi:diguanylate cyclase (GGDEF)-like protein